MRPVSAQALPAGFLHSLDALLRGKACGRECRHREGMSHPSIETAIVGAGQSGLAVSALLTRAGRDHVVFDRGVAGNRWRTERWDSLRLLTPNWLSRLPGWSYDGDDSDGFMTANEVGRYLHSYARSIGAPIMTGCEVRDVTTHVDDPVHRFAVQTSHGVWHARHVVVAAGPHANVRVPDAIADVSQGATTPVIVPSTEYRRPAALPPGGVLVVGASSSGVQIADELVRAGRDVVLAVGRHTRIPRRYRGMDIFWWLDRLGRLAATVDDVSPSHRTRPETSLQLAGAAAGAVRQVDLPALQAVGVRLVGRLVGLDRAVAHFDESLDTSIGAAEAAMGRLLDAVDAHIRADRLSDEMIAADRPRPFRALTPPRRLDLRAASIGTIVLATGLRPDHSWLHIPVVDAGGEIVQRRGATPVPGLWVAGQRFQHRRDATYIDGARHNARDVVTGILGAPTALPTRRERSGAH
jgi:putative flavoprotein involved in K+ transport